MSLLKAVKEIGKDMSVYGITNILSQLVSLLLLPLYTKKLSPEDYGIFALIGICISGYAIFSNLGISSAIFRFTGTSNSETEKEEYLGNAQLINLLTNALTLVIFLLLINKISSLVFENNINVQYAYYIAILGTLSSFSNVLISFLKVSRETIKIAKSSIINLVVSVISTFIGLIYLNLGVCGALLGGAAGNVVSFLYLFYVTPKNKLILNHSRIKTLLKFALPIFPHKIIGFFIPITSQIILVKYMDLNTLGMYNIALKFALPLVLFINLFQNAYAPIRFEIYKQGNTNTDLFAKINLLYFMVTFTGYATVSLFGDWILVMVTDVKFHEAGFYIPFLALIPLAQSIYFAFGTGVEFSKSPKFYPIISLIGILFIVLTSILTIPRYQIIGAALSTTIGWLIMALCMFIYAKKIFPIKFLWREICILLIVTFIIVSLKYVIEDKWVDITLWMAQIGICVIIIGPYIQSLKYVHVKKSDI
jgi:O-antigen/teichoic acid export membrane protein